MEMTNNIIPCAALTGARKTTNAIPDTACIALRINCFTMSWIVNRKPGLRLGSELALRVQLYGRLKRFKTGRFGHWAQD